MNQKFIDAVDANNVVSVRLSLSNELMLDPRGNSFREMLGYAETRITNLYQTNDGKIYDCDTNKWNEEFLINLKNDLDLNFSSEKLSLFEKVVKVALKTKADKLDEEDNARNKKRQAANEDANPYYDYKKYNKYVYGGVAVASLSTAIAGLCVEKTAITITGIVGLATGGYLLYKELTKDNEK